MSSTTFIGNILDFPSTAAALFRFRKTQRNFINKHIVKDLEAAEKTNDGSLDKGDFKKITSYYGLAIPAILGESIAVLRGKALTERERFALTYLGAVTGLFDDFFDKHKLADEKIRMLFEHPDQLIPENSNEKLFLDFYKKALAHMDDPKHVLHYLRKVYDAQIESKKQAIPGLTRDEILQITLHKGAVSVLSYRVTMEHPFLPGEEDALYQMGGLMQFGNDIFDVYKDRNGGIYTLLTSTKKMREVRDIFTATMKKSFHSVTQLDYKKRDIKKYLRIMSLCLCCRCYVCFDQLESKEEKTGNEFRPEEYSRQDLVCDMEKKINLWRSLQYHLNEKINFS